MIRVMVVEDSPVVQELVVQALESDPEIQVVGAVASGDQALEHARILRPDVITMDIELPGMSGLDATQEIMRVQPTPIIILTGQNAGRDNDVAFHSLAAGAMTVIDKPASFLGPGGENFSRLLVQQVKMFHRVRVNTRALADSGSKTRPDPTLPDPAPAAPVRRELQAQPRPQPALPRPAVRALTGSQVDVIGIGASAGGPACLVKLLSALPADFRIPIVLVQHISRGFLEGFLGWLSGQVRRPASIAVEGELPRAGEIHSSREDAHLQFSADGRFHYSDAPPIRGHRPAIDALLASLAEVYRNRAAGIVLTGMGADGAAGLKRLREVGGPTYAQDEASSLVFGMPQEALKQGAVDRVDSLESIARALCALGTGRTKLVP